MVKNDLSYSLTIDPSSTAVEGVDYTFIGNSTSFNNGSIVADVRISGNFERASTEGKTVIFKLSSPDAEVGVNDVFSLESIQILSI